MHGRQWRQAGRCRLWWGAIQRRVGPKFASVTRVAVSLLLTLSGFSSHFSRRRSRTAQGWAGPVSGYRFAATSLRHTKDAFASKAAQDKGQRLHSDSRQSPNLRMLGPNKGPREY